MAQYTKANFKTQKNNRYSDALPSGSTTRANHRDQAEDVADSAMFIDDNFIDEDSFATDSATKAPSQQSVKAYVDSQKIHRTETAVSSSEILNIFSTPKTLVSAPGSGKFIRVLSVTFEYTHVSAAYATNTTLLIEYSSTNYYASGSITGVIASTQNSLSFPSSNIQNAGALVSSVEDKAVELTALGNPTAGNGTAVVYVQYLILDV